MQKISADKQRISIVIPNYNGAATIGMCLEAAYNSAYGDFEVIVVDDGSRDNSVEIIRRYPCRLVEFKEQSGASKARNEGAKASSGEILFFIDSDCLINPDALAIAAKQIRKHGTSVIIGGTYSRRPFDPGFFNMFQSVFIHYSETKNCPNPDYIASHAMVINAGEFLARGGFPEEFMPILEDVEFSHRMRRSGFRLLMCPKILVRHVFGFSLYSSLRNAVRKSLYWTAYSMGNRDFFTDSGMASVEMKSNVLACAVTMLLLAAGVILNNSFFLLAVLLLFLVNISVNRRLLTAFFKTGGTVFGLFSCLYLTSLYALAVGVGVTLGIFRQFIGRVQ